MHRYTGSFARPACRGAVTDHVLVVVVMSPVPRKSRPKQLRSVAHAVVAAPLPHQEGPPLRSCNDIVSASPEWEPYPDPGPSASLHISGLNNDNSVPAYAIVEHSYSSAAPHISCRPAVGYHRIRSSSALRRGLMFSRTRQPILRETARRCVHSQKKDLRNTTPKSGFPC